MKMRNEAAARQALSRMNLREVAVAAHYQGLTADMVAFAQANSDEQQEALQARRVELCEAYGLQPLGQSKPFAFSGGVAIIPVHGTLINRFGSSWGFVTGYNFIKSQTTMAGLDPDVTHIVYDHNSYGGEAAGCFEAAAAIAELANGKPTLAVVDSNCYSASFALACGCDRIAVTPSGGVGSVGVVAMHVDMSKMLEDWGINITLLHAGAHKVDGNPYEALSEPVKADMEKSLAKSYAAFTGFVAKGRNMDEKAVRDTEARTYRADDALAIGFIDAVSTPALAVAAFLGESSGSNSQPQQEGAMSQTNQPAQPDAAAQAAAQATAVQTASADAKTAERARIGGILNCEEAKGREALANHFATQTDMTVEAAKAALAVSPVAPAAGAQPNAFKQAMDADKHPNVGADENANKGDGSTMSKADRIRQDAKNYGL